MATLLAHRCLHHPVREAVARCPECNHFFCRECIAEHDDRVVCAACLKKLGGDPAKKARRRINLWPFAQLGTGLVGAWLCFYLLGRLFLALPDDTHGESLWKTRFIEALGNDDDE